VAENEDVEALSLELTDRAYRDVQSAQDWLRSFPEDAAQRFNGALDAQLDFLCRSLAERLAAEERLSPDEDASLAFSRPVYRHTFHTGRTRQRRSSAGSWRIFYVLLNTKESSDIPDRVRMVAIRHGAARPLSEWEQEGTEE
jgi:plasmid stabilization system protein ParE